eukprot:3938279-Rhodomonas_salina.1
MKQSLHARVAIHTVSRPRHMLLLALCAVALCHGPTTIATASSNHFYGNSVVIDFTRPASPTDSVYVQALAMRCELMVSLEGIQADVLGTAQLWRIATVTNTRAEARRLTVQEAAAMQNAHALTGLVWGCCPNCDILDQHHVPGYWVEKSEPKFGLFYATKLIAYHVGDKDKTW